MLSSNEFSNVYDLAASRKVKAATGKGQAIKATTPDSPEMIKHEDEAMALGNPVKPKQSRMDKAFDKFNKVLGLELPE